MASAVGAAGGAGARSQPANRSPAASPNASDQGMDTLVMGSSKNRARGLAPASEAAQVAEQRAASGLVEGPEPFARRRRFATMPEDRIDEGVGATIMEESRPAQAFPVAFALADAGQGRGPPFGAGGIALAEFVGQPRAHV